MLNKFLASSATQTESTLGIGKTVLLMHMEDPNSFVDSSIYNAQIVGNASSNAQITANAKMFGNYSMWSSNDRGIRVIHNEYNQLYDHDFTVEGFFWLYETSKTYGHRIIGTYDSPTLSPTDNKWLISANSGAFGYGIGLTITYGYNNNILQILSESHLDVMRWHHFAAVRNGNTFSLYLDGILVGSETASQPIHFDASDIYLATSQNSGQFSGYLDEIRIKKAVVYTGNFTVPTTQFSVYGEGVGPHQ